MGALSAADTLTNKILKKKAFSGSGEPMFVRYGQWRSRRNRAFIT